MKEISIIIRANKEQTETYVHILSPLLNAMDYELIIMNKTGEDYPIERKHSVYSYTGPYDQFMEFCMMSSVGNRVMIIEAGMMLYPELISKIMELLHEKGHHHITVNIKSYLSQDRSYFFHREEPLVYCRDVRGFKRECDMILEDFSFIHEAEDCIAYGVEKLMAGRQYNALKTWFSNYILMLPEHSQELFYDCLEHYKALSQTLDNVSELNGFLLSAVENSEYAHYVTLLNLLKEYDVTPSEKIQELLNSLSIPECWNYKGWLLREFLLKAHHTLPLFMFIPIPVLKEWLSCLIRKDTDALDYMYRFLMINGNDGMSKIENQAYACIFSVFIDSLQDHCESAESIVRLLKTTDCFLNLNIDVLIAEPWLLYLADSRKLERDGKVSEAISKLNDACNTFPSHFPTIRHLIKQIRNKYNLYPFVLSICMIVKNEEKNLERCLSSLKLLMDSGLAELIIVDTGSSDRTIEIASGYTKKLYAYPWSGSFSAARNNSILHADGEYLLIMDADEEIGESGIKFLENWFHEGPYKEYKTCTLQLISFTDEQHTQYAVMAQPRIFKNTGLFCYSSTVHNQPVCQIPATSLGVDILHYGYIMTEDIREVKFLRTATLLKHELEKNPNHIYYRYQLSTSYAMHGDLKEAAKQVDIYMKLIQNRPILYDVVLMYYNNAASIYLNCHRYDDVLKISDKALNIQKDFIDFLFYKACILFAREEYDSALSYIDGYMNLVDTFHTHQIAKDGRFAFYTIGCKEDVKQMSVIANCRTGRYDASIQMGFELRVDSQLKNCLFDIIGACFQTERFQDLACLYTQRVAMSLDKCILDVFVHFTKAFLSMADDNKRKKCLSAFSAACADDDSIKKNFGKIQGDCSGYPLFTISLAEKYYLDGIDFEKIAGFLSEIAPFILSFEAGSCFDAIELRKIKKLAAILLHKTEKLLCGLLSADEIVMIYNKYMEICARLIEISRLDLLEGEERLFVAHMLAAIGKISNGDWKEAADDMEDAGMYYHNMEGFIKLAEELLIPHCTDQEADTTDDKDTAVKFVMQSETIRARIMEKGCRMNSSEVLAMFDEYDETNGLDADLCSLKSAALLLCGDTTHAQEVLSEAARRYPMQYELYFCQYGLYLLQQNQLEAAKAYAAMGMLDPSNTNKLTPYTIKSAKAGPYKVLHGTMDMTPRIALLAKSLNDRGISASSLNYASQDTKPYTDYALNVNAIESGEEILAETFHNAINFIANYDVFHFHYGTTLTFNHFDLIALKELGKKVIMHYWKWDASVIEKSKDFSHYISRCIVSDEGILEQLKDIYEDIRLIRPMIDLVKVKPTYGGARKDVFTIVHAPTSRERKGTDHIVKVIENLMEKYAIDFKLIQGMPHDKAMLQYRDADLIVDQILDGSYGMLAVEGMALGKPVICYISDYMKEKYPASLPILNANTENLQDTIEYLINNKHTLPDIGLKGRLYAEEYHDMEKEIGKLIELYRD